MILPHAGTRVPVRGSRREEKLVVIVAGAEWVLKKKRSLAPDDSQESALCAPAALNQTDRSGLEVQEAREYAE